MHHITAIHNIQGVSANPHKIAKIICGHTSTNLHVEQFEEIRTMLGDVEVELIGIDTMSYDIVYRFPSTEEEEKETKPVLFNLPLNATLKN